MVAGVFLVLGTLSAAADEAGELSQETLARLVRACAPEVDSTTQAAIIAVESGGSTWILHDDNDNRVYDPPSRKVAEATLTALISRNRSAYASSDRGIDVGLAQINTNNLAYLGVSANDLLDPCTNLHASARIIVDAYVRERTMLSQEGGWRGDEIALRRALQDYNSGRPDGDDAYVRAVYATLDGQLVREVGNSMRVAQVPIIPLRFTVPTKASKRPGSTENTHFYHASWATLPPSRTAHVDEFRP